MTNDVNTRIMGKIRTKWFFSKARIWQGAIIVLMGFLFFDAPVYAQEKEKDVPYVPSPDEVVDRMLDMARVGPGDYVIDLGCGDGRILVAAAKRGATGLGVDIDGALIEEARKNAKKAGVSDQVMFLKQDIFETDISRANVITMYLLPSLIRELRPQFIEQLQPGARIVSHDFDMGAWEPDRHKTINNSNLISDTLILDPIKPIQELETADPITKKLNLAQPAQVFLHNVYYWQVPADARGLWQWETHGEAFAMEVNQRFQQIHPEIRAGDTDLTIKRATLAGARINIIAENPATNHQYVFNGRINGDKIKGKVQISSKDNQWVENWNSTQNN